MDKTSAGERGGAGGVVGTVSGGTAEIGPVWTSNRQLCRTNAPAMLTWNMPPRKLYPKDRRHKVHRLQQHQQQRQPGDARTTAQTNTTTAGKNRLACSSPETASRGGNIELFIGGPTSTETPHLPPCLPRRQQDTSRYSRVYRFEE